MLRIALMIEGQNGLTWERWRGVLEAAQRLGFDAVFRSDHFTNAAPPDLESLELWTSLTQAAATTERIEFGPLVAPVTFRHPAITARVAAAVDDLSGGRLVLGIGAGWQDREHHNFGVPFPPVATRYEMLTEYLEVVTRLLRSDEPVSFTGKHYSLHDAILLPRPQRRGGPPILVGGNGPRRTLPLAARFADEWNAVFAGPTELQELEARFDRLLDEASRPREAVLRSAMVGTWPWAEGETGDTDVEADLERGVIAGDPEMWITALRRYEAAGVQRIMLQWLNLDDLAGIERYARTILPAFAGSAG